MHDYQRGNNHCYFLITRVTKLGTLTLSAFVSFSPQAAVYWCSHIVSGMHLTHYDTGYIELGSLHHHYFIT